MLGRDNKMSALIFVVVAAACCVSVTLASLCDVCRCSNDDGMLSAVCQCSGNAQKLELTEQLVDQQRDENVLTLSVSECREVVLGARSVVKLPRLKSLKVSRSSRVQLRADSVDRVDELVLEDVASLELEPKALLAANVRMLQLHRVGVARLPRLALADLQGLQSLMLLAVNLTHVEPAGIRLDMGDKSEIIVQSSQFGTVESGGVLVKAVDTFSVVRSSFDAVSEEGLNVTARKAVLLDQNSFGPADLTNRALCASAPQVNITRNSFVTLPDGLLAKNRRRLKPGQKLVFADNAVSQSLLEVPDIAVGKSHDDAVQYVGNSFECTCDQHQVESLKNLLESDYAPMLKNNFCASKKCPRHVSHAMLLRHLQSRNDATCSQDELCALTPPTEHADTTTATTKRTTTTPPSHKGPHTGSGSATVLPLAATLVACLVVSQH